jgi:hypothetical protein
MNVSPTVSETNSPFATNVVINYWLRPSRLKMGEVEVVRQSFWPWPGNRESIIAALAITIF